jgi:phosphatidylserine/phosphatidylglycerophosphate/cardiolipin synthase-like enzyme
LGLNSAWAESIADFSKQFTKPQFIQNNDDALKFRLAMIDNAGKGANVRITTFNFDYGRAVEALAAHICRATARGVKVELIVDSKAGEIAGRENPFNATPDVKEAEELFQYMARCGTKVVIHNYTTSYVTVLGSRLPNIFGVQDGSSVNPLIALARIKHLRQRISALVQPTLSKLGVKSSVDNVLANVQSLVLEIKQLMGADGPGQDGSIGVISQDYRAILQDSIWTELDDKKMKVMVTALEKALVKDPELNDVRTRLRIFNRLNHRKLVLVEDGGEKCVIIGGRNLGDNYLTSKEGSYRDGDVFFCLQNDLTRQKFFDQATVDLNQLESASPDPTLSPKAQSSVVTIKADKSVPYRALDVKRIQPMKYAAASLKGEDLPDFSDPSLLTSQWDPKSDGVRMALLRALEQEQKEAYIETAYAEFDEALRHAIEDALKRGVKVHLVTNGLFISDGASQLIRLWMARWKEMMVSKYGEKHFQVAYAPLSAGHMIHFKGAGFRCQKDPLGKYYRTYFIGSHNFHPRSGYSDKENTLEWHEATDATCATDGAVDPANDLISLRVQYYRAQDKVTKGPILEVYPTLASELNEVAGSPSADNKSRNLAMAILQSLYLSDGGESGIVLVFPQQLEKIQRLLDVSGFRDLVGELL